MLSVLRQYNLEKEFPKVVVDSARAHGDRIRERDLVGRVDCRAHRVVTIDPDDAKDFDDAICVERASGGGWKVWVHVADVAHYVKPGSPLDHEALFRSVSKTRKAVVVHEGHLFAGVGAEIVARLQEALFDVLDAPVLRVTNRDVPQPYATNLEKLVIPDAPRVIEAVRKTLAR